MIKPLPLQKHMQTFLELMGTCLLGEQVICLHPRIRLSCCLARTHGPVSTTKRLYITMKLKQWLPSIKWSYFFFCKMQTIKRTISVVVCTLARQCNQICLDNKGIYSCQTVIQLLNCICNIPDKKHILMPSNYSVKLVAHYLMTARGMASSASSDIRLKFGTWGGMNPVGIWPETLES